MKISIYEINDCNFQDPREALILSLKREVGALQTENDHLRIALNLSNLEAQNEIRSESKSMRCLYQPFIL